MMKLNIMLKESHLHLQNLLHIVNSRSEKMLIAEIMSDSRALKHQNFLQVIH